MADMIEIAQTKKVGDATDPNKLINTTVKVAIKSLVEADQLTNDNGVMIYWMEVLRASLNCDLAYSIVVA